MSSLIQNLSSEYLGASHYLYSRNLPSIVYAYVESYDDIPFWRTVLADFESERLCFEIMIPSTTSLKKGKRKVLDLIPATGKFLIKCVDSDYDYLIEDATDISRAVNHDQYIFQTYTYSIENYYCLAENLHSVCARAVLNDRQMVDWPCFWRSYSRIIYPLFLWSVYFYREGLENLFPISRFCMAATWPACQEEKGLDELLGDLEVRVRGQVHLLKSEFPLYIPAVRLLSGKLAALGVHEDDTYLFMQGHSVFNNVARLVKTVCAVLKHERLDGIKRLARSAEERKNDIRYYLANIQDVEAVMKSGTSYKSSALYRKIQEDLCVYVNGFC